MVRAVWSDDISRPRSADRAARVEAGEAIGMLLEWWRGCTAMGGVLRNRAIFMAFQGAPALATKLKDPT
jgi:hypothetical protein